MKNADNRKLQSSPSETESFPNTSEFHTTLSLAEEALSLAETHQTPPYPTTYEVLYTYAAGDNELVNTRVNTLIENTGNLSIYDVSQIHCELLDTQDKSRSVNDEISRQIKNELDEIIKLIHSHTDINQNYSGTLDKSVENLNASASPKHLREVIELLIVDNKKMRAETDKLASNLEQSKTQMQEIRKELAEARENEMLDPVTNLGNRRWFESNLKIETEAAKKSENEFCLVFADLDHFKKINDNFGHLVGDQVLRFFGSLLLKNIKGKDICARYGGEEFAIILPNTTMADAKQLTESIRVQLESANLILSASKKPIGKITASFGLVRINKKDDIESVMQRVDENLYEAKNDGRNRIVCENTSKR